MKKNLKRTLAIIIVVFIMLTSAPLQSFVGMDWNWFDFSVRASDDDVLAPTGKCGNDVYWSYNSTTGELTISGTGNMSYYSEEGSPFYGRGIKSVIIEDGVTSVSAHAFYFCTRLKNVVIADSVTQIGYWAFQSCHGLESVTIGSGLETIAEGGFRACESLTSIKLPEGFVSIGKEAFGWCKSLKNVTLPKSLKSIGSNAFLECQGIENVYIDDLNAWCGVELIDTPLSYGASVYLNGKLLTDLIIPENITSIANRTFKGWSSIKSVTIHDNVTSIGEFSFSGCTSLSNIVLPDGITSIGRSAFSGCTSLSNIVLPDSITSIGGYAFSGCTSLSEVYCGKTLKFIGWCAFDNCDSLEYIYFDGSERDFYRLLEGSSSFDVFGYDESSGPEIIFTSNDPISKYEKYDRIVYGSYPQSKVSDSALISQLNKLAVKWNEAEDRTFCDVDFNGEKYRAILVDDEVLWFEFEPIVWRILNPLTGLLLSECILDEQKYSDSDNDYENSHIKEWLNNDFYNIAFNNNHKANIAPHTSSVISFWNNTYHNSGDYVLDTIFILGKYDISELNGKTVDDQIAFGNNLKTNGSDYSNSRKDWWLRTPVYGSEKTAFCMNYDSFITYTHKNVSTVMGVRPAMYLNLENVECEHVYYPEITEPTCTTQGYTTYACPCGESYVVDYTDIIAHTYTSSITTQPTHLTEGVETFTCTCGDTYTKSVAKLTEHKYNAVVTTPTCTAQGYTTHTCECGDSYIDNYVNANGHKHTAQITTQPTHLMEGVETFTCVCGDTYTKAIDKLEGHTYTSQITKPATHLAEGVETFTCACGDSYIKTIDKLKGHTHTSQITTPATHLAEGVETFTCACGDSYTESIPKLEGHTYISQITTQPTHLAEGVETFTCACGDSYTKPIAKIAEHNYTVLNSVAPTCETEGYTMYHCECGHTYSEKKSATGHNYNGDYCTECGESKTDNCTCNCHKSGFMGFIWKIINLFNKLFKSNKTCACGVSHY